MKSLYLPILNFENICYNLLILQVPIAYGQVMPRVEGTGMAIMMVNIFYRSRKC